MIEIEDVSVGVTKRHDELKGQLQRLIEKKRGIGEDAVKYRKVTQACAM